jgi:hypothetical protein
MPKQFIKDLLEVDFARNYVQSITDGRFTAVNSSVATLRHDGIQYNCDLSLATDFQFAGTNKRSEISQAYTDYSGYNRKLLTEDGIYDTTLALAEFARVGPERRYVKEESLAILSRFEQRDSHESFIYNMLVSWLKAHLYSGAPNEDELLKVIVSPYSDSHAVYATDGSTSEITHEIELGFPVSADRLMQNRWDIRNKDNYWSRPFVLRYVASAASQEAFYLSHVMGRADCSGLNFDVPLPGLDTSQLLLEPINGPGVLTGDFSEIPWDKPFILWSWIVDYVKLNRLEQAFAAAFETLGAMAVQPKWSSLEANQWQACELVAVFSDFLPTRARVHLNLEGDPYCPFIAANEFIVSESPNQPQYLVASALTNYYMWYGLYAVLHDAARSRDDWRTVFSSVADELQALQTPIMRAAVISAITGREYSSCMNYGCCMYVDTATMADVRELGPVHSPDGSVPSMVKVNALYAPVSGALIIGTLAGDLSVVQHLKAVQTMGAADVATHVFGFEQALVLSSTYRLFGHDIVLEDGYTGVPIQPWANSRECVIEASSIEFDPNTSCKLHVRSSMAREGRSHLLPNVRSLLANGSATLVIQRPTLTMHQWQKRRTLLKPYLLMKREKKKYSFLIKSPINYNAVIFSARSVFKPVKQDFQVATHRPTPLKPEGPQITGTEAKTDVNTEPGPSDVYGVE